MSTVSLDENVNTENRKDRRAREWREAHLKSGQRKWNMAGARFLEGRGRWIGMLARDAKQHAATVLRRKRALATIQGIGQTHTVRRTSRYEKKEKNV